MCGVCGCADHRDTMHHAGHDEKNLVAHHHDDEHTILIQQNIFAKNKQFAESNQQFFTDKQVLALNVMSSPGSGKTTLLAKTMTDLKTLIPQLACSVLVGDQETNIDATILSASGAQAVQINTGNVCHLDAHMVSHALPQIHIQERMILFIENIGNLVCPALFPLGESHRVVILSVTEGDNKPLKYPAMFHAADLLIITKIDLLPYVNFNMEKCIAAARQIQPNITVLQLSALTGKGISEWYQWLSQHQAP